MVESMIVKTEWVVKYGFEESALLWWIVHWIKKNKADEINFHDGKTWTYNSKKAWSELFPFWTERQVRRLLDNLIERRAIVTGCYNKQPFDRTLWYALGDNFEEIDRTKPSNDIGPNRPMSLDQTVQPIPVKNTIKKDTKKKEYRQNSPEFRLSSFFWESLSEDGTCQKEPDLNNWSDEFEKIHRIDERPWSWILKTLAAVLEDPFWKKNVRSPHKFRLQINSGKLDKFVPDEWEDDETVIKKIREKYGDG